jgi:hypothetical protein
MDTMVRPEIGTAHRADGVIPSANGIDAANNPIPVISV